MQKAWKTEQEDFRWLLLHNHRAQPLCNQDTQSSMPRPISRQLLEISREEVPQSLWQPVPMVCNLNTERVSWCSDVPHCLPVYSHCLLFLDWALVKRPCLDRDFAISLQVVIDTEIPPESSLSWIVPALSASPHRRNAPVPYSWTGFSLIFHTFVALGSPELHTCTALAMLSRGKQLPLLTCLWYFV